MLKTHVKIHEDRSVACPICTKVFKSKLVLKTHKYKTHKQGGPINKKKIFPCPVCSKVYGSERGLRFHIQLHKEVCPVISEQGKNPSSGEEVEIISVENEIESASFLFGDEVVVVAIEDDITTDIVEQEVIFEEIIPNLVFD